MKLSRFVRCGSWILVAAFVLLPLYELSDYSEVWANDGQIVATAFLGLLIGTAIVSAAFFRRLVIVMFAAFLDCRVRTGSGMPAFFGSFDPFNNSPPDRNLSLIFSSLRI